MCAWRCTSVPAATPFASAHSFGSETVYVPPPTVWIFLVSISR